MLKIYHLVGRAWIDFHQDWRFRKSNLRFRF